MNKEYKSLQFELKECGEADDDFGYFEGYASTFGNIDRVDDIIEDGAFAKCLTKCLSGERKVKSLWQHDNKELIGDYPLLSENTKGLFVKCRLLLKTKRGYEAYHLAKAGILTTMSIGFRIPKGGCYYKDGIRHIKEIDLFEISLVTEPANTLATIDSVKSLDEIESMKDINDFLQEKGLSNNERNILISKIKSVCKIEKEEDAEDELTKQIVQNLKICL